MAAQTAPPAGSPTGPPIDFSKPLDLSTLKGKTALVTGAASGIGKGVCEVLSKAGAYLVLADINTAAGEAFAKELNDQGGQ